MKKKIGHSFLFDSSKITFKYKEVEGKKYTTEYYIEIDGYPYYRCSNYNCDECLN